MDDVGDEGMIGMACMREHLCFGPVRNKIVEGKVSPELRGLWRGTQD